VRIAERRLRGGLGLAAAALGLAAAPPDVPTVERRVDVPRAGRVTLVLDRDVYEHARPDLGDLRVVDARLQPIAESFWAHHRLDPAHDARLDRLLVRNVVTGCTVAVNRALRARAGAIPPEAAMHDWWLALVAAAFGHTGRVGQPTVLYRQHDANQIGARGAGVGDGVGAAARGRVGRYYRRTRVQARGFRDRYRDHLDPRARAIVDAYAMIKILTTTAAKKDIGVVVNATRDADEAGLVFRQLDIAATRFLERSLRFDGYIVSDPGVREAVLGQRPIVDHLPQSPAAPLIQIWTARPGSSITSLVRRSRTRPATSGTPIVSKKPSCTTRTTSPVVSTRNRPPTRHQFQ
jgi:hypothetical protein